MAAFLFLNYFGQKIAEHLIDRSFPFKRHFARRL